jgi:hypothetical protein
MKLFKPKWIQEWTNIIKKEGFKSFVKQKGWKFVVAFILFYLIRDSILYIIIPYFALTELGACN